MVANFEETNNQCVNFYNSELYSWKGLKFRSKSEIKIAEELDRRGIFFLPNCVARLNGKNIEADFLINYKNLWGILEVDGKKYHTNKQKDKDRDNSITHLTSVSFIKRYSSLDCYNNAYNVVDLFLYLLEEDYGNNGISLDIITTILITHDIHLLEGYYCFWQSYKRNHAIKDDIVDYYLKLQSSILKLEGGSIKDLSEKCPIDYDVIFHANSIWREMLDTICSDYPLNFWEYLTFIYKFKQLLDSEWSYLVEDETKELFIKMSSCKLGSIPFTRFEWQ